MVWNISQVRVFVACPGDMDKAKAKVKFVCEEINQIFRDQYPVSLFMMDWKASVVSQCGPRLEDVIIEQIGEYDVFIGILGSYFGTSTGAINPQTGEPYQSGTEEEFYKAYESWKEKDTPTINFYFKKNKMKSTKKQSQLKRVLKFRDMLRNKNRLWVVDFGSFQEFERIVRNYLLKVVFDTDKKIKEQRIREKIGVGGVKPRLIYPAIDDYITRRVYPRKNITSTDLMFLREEMSQDIIDVINKERRVVLVGDAGIGKSTELKRVAAEFSKNTSPFYPFLVPLNTYVNQRLEELFPSEWRQVPESQLLVILDGLDEMKWIGSKDRYDGIRQIELFAKQHPDAHILVSCRTNFYQAETNEKKGALDGFKTYVLLNLNQEQVADYVNTRL